MLESPTIHEAFLDWMVSRAPRKDSTHTRQAYHNDIYFVSRIIAQQAGRQEPSWEVVRVGELSKRILRDAFAEFSESRSPASIARAQSTWRGLCRFCVEEEWIARDPMLGLVSAKVPSQLPKPLKGEEKTASELLKWLAEGGRSKGRDLWNARDYAVIATLLLTGVRSGEIRSLTCGDIFGAPGEQRIRVLGKGRKERAVPIEAPLMEVIADYLYSRQQRFPSWERDDASVLFVNNQNTHLSPTQLRWIVAQCLKQAGLGSTPQRGALIHGLRATYATLIAAQGATASEIMKLLGHESLNTSQLYIKAIGSEVRLSAAANPLYKKLYRDKEL